MPDEFIKPKTYMIVTQRSSANTTFCELAGVKNSLRHWMKWHPLSKENNPYFVYKFNPSVPAYELHFDGQKMVDVFLDGMTDKESKEIYDIIIDTLT